ncbi:MAG: cytidylate kinase-like family protein [Clostridia bacterium]|nr:cytidylate kinase-like family protein [Clostridia bacterium]
MPIITVSRQMCSLGDEVAEELSRKLGWELFTRNSLLYRFPDIAETPYDQRMLSESAKYFLKPGKENGTFLEQLTRELEDYLEGDSAILMGFGSQMIFAERRDAVHVRVFAPKAVRIIRAKKQFHVSDEEAEKILDAADRRHKRFVSTVFGKDLTDPAYYNIVLNTAALSVAECASAAIALHKERESRRQIELETDQTKIFNKLSEYPMFKTEAEAEFARILDMYQMDWKYEPKTFPVEWDAEGNVTMAFSPDFYLTKFDTYIELTTMNQKYVTIKNKKAKKLRELYPGINIKVVYKKDFYSLIERYNLNKGDQNGA